MASQKMENEENKRDFNLTSEIIEASVNGDVQIFNAAWDEEGVYFYQVFLKLNVILTTFVLDILVLKLVSYNSYTQSCVSNVFMMFLT